MVRGLSGAHDLRFERTDSRKSEESNSQQNIIPRIKQIFFISKLIEKLELTLIDHQGATKFKDQLVNVLTMLTDLKHLKLSIAMTWDLLEELLRAIEDHKLVIETLEIHAYYFHPLHEQFCHGFYIKKCIKNYIKFNFN